MIEGVSIHRLKQIPDERGKTTEDAEHVREEIHKRLGHELQPGPSKNQEPS